MPKGIYPRPSLDERLWSKVDKTTTCWLWKGSLCGSYGRIKKTGAKISTPTHRVSWELVNGTVPEGVLVLHKCDNRICVRPSHLFLGSYQDNTVDMIRKGRVNPRRGVENRSAKLNDTLVREIRSKYIEMELSQTELSREYGICQSRISSIVNNKAWKHV